MKIKTKVVFYCSASKGDNDSYYGIDGLLNKEYERLSGTEIEFHTFGGTLNNTLFAEAVKGSHVVITDAWMNGDCDRMASAVKTARAISPGAAFFAELMEGSYEVAVHKYAIPFKDWTDECIINAIKEKAASLKLIDAETILVVDDNEVNLAAAKEQLGGQYNLLLSSSYLEAMNILGSHDVDILLTDMMMPGEEDNQGTRGDGVGALLPMGTFVVLKALEVGTKRIVVVSDTNHHNHPAAHAIEQLKGGEQVSFLCGYSCPLQKDGSKNWAIALS